MDTSIFKHDQRIGRHDAIYGYEQRIDVDLGDASTIATARGFRSRVKLRCGVCAPPLIRP